MGFADLPGTRAEVAMVGELWQRYADVPGSEARTLVDAAATERALKQAAPGARILHLATHGFFLGDECRTGVDGTRSGGGLVSLAPKSASAIRPRPIQSERPENPLLYSGLALAGANRRRSAGPEDEDGILTAEEVATLPLGDVDWAVLSACDTGLGTVAVGEGVLGLRRAFQIAGARTVIMSLWAVEDRASREWMEALYRLRLERRVDTADAVRGADVSVLRERRAQRTEDAPVLLGRVCRGR